LKSGSEFLLVVHNNSQGINNGIWGLPGGRIDWGERPVQAARRELYEELTVELDELHDVGAWQYKGYQHKVYGTVFGGEIGQIDNNEILAVDWFTLNDIRRLSESDKLHTGFELASVERFTNLLVGLTPEG
jgi:8-oxo-dGTP diphosphatase